MANIETMRDGIFQKVKAYIEKYRMVAPGDRIVTGVSGGADSVCLFLMLCELASEMDFQITVVHVNHGMRREACRDAAYVEGLCRERNIPFVLAEEDVKAFARKEKLSEEEAGRIVRYRAFEKALGTFEKTEGTGKIAVAHNADDRAETVLFHLFRGTGLAGASGIRPVRENIIRPILCLGRKEIEEYLREKQVAFCIDHTNMEDTYTRNRIRNHILPFAEAEVCKGAASHICEAADIILETEDYIREQTKKAFHDCVAEKQDDIVVLDINRLNKNAAFIRKQVLLEALEGLTEKRKNITSAHLKAMTELLEKEGTKQIFLPYGLTVTKEYARLILKKATAESEQNNKGKDGMQEYPPIQLPLEKLETESSGEENSGMELEVPGLGTARLTLLPAEKVRKGSGDWEDFFIKSKDIPEKSYTKWFDYDKITKYAIFRTRKTGDYLTIHKDGSRKTLKDYMIGEKIPKYMREQLYVLADGSHIMWVPGHRISEYYKISEGTKYILQVEIK